MHVTFIPVAGTLFIAARIEGAGLTINDQVTRWDGFSTDPVIEYGEQSGVAVFTNTTAHSYHVVPTTWVDPTPPAPVDPAALVLALLEAERQSWVCDRWQIKTVLGQVRWQTIVEFGTAEGAPWGLQTVIEDAVIIPRVSQTVDLLAFILGMTEDEVDDLFRTAMALVA